MAQTKTSHGDWRETMRKQQASLLRQARPCEKSPKGFKVIRSVGDGAKVYTRQEKIGGLFASIGA